MKRIAELHASLYFKFKTTTYQLQPYEEQDIHQKKTEFLKYWNSKPSSIYPFEGIFFLIGR